MAETKRIRNGKPGAIAILGGCPVMTYLEPQEGGGYYHEHCDCDGGVPL